MLLIFLQINRKAIFLDSLSYFKAKPSVIFLEQLSICISELDFIPSELFFIVPSLIEASLLIIFRAGTLSSAFLSSFSQFINYSLELRNLFD